MVETNCWLGFDVEVVVVVDRWLRERLQRFFRVETVHVKVRVIQWVFNRGLSLLQVWLNILPKQGARIVEVVVL